MVGSIFDSGLRSNKIATAVITSLTESRGLRLPFISATSFYDIASSALVAFARAGRALASSLSQSVLMAVASSAASCAIASSLATPYLTISAALVLSCTIKVFSATFLAVSMSLGCISISSYFISLTFSSVMIKVSKPFLYFILSVSTSFRFSAKRLWNALIISK